MFRRIVICLPLTLLLLTVAEAQQPKKVPWIGYLSFGGVRNSVQVEAFRQGLRELGYAEGKDTVVEYRFAARKLDRLNEHAAELVRLKVNLIVTGGPAPTRAAKAATLLHRREEPETPRR